MSSAYYNEIDNYAADWLENLIRPGHIAPGDVDRRSIVDVRPDDLAGYDQCHFFAGIAGWSYALRLAGWPDDEPVWTGSCPCQPLSSAGQRKGHADERHLWPAFYSLIAECRPATVFGEQVASKDGREWLAAVRTDLEGLGYAVGAADLCAASVGAPHIRQRLWWLAKADYERQPAGSEGFAAVGHGTPARPDSGLANTNSKQQRPLSAPLARDEPETGERDEDPSATSGLCGAIRPDPTNGFWRDADWLFCRDGKWRPVEPGSFPLAHGLPGRVGQLRAYGNAIVPQLAAEFIRATLNLED